MNKCGVDTRAWKNTIKSYDKLISISIDQIIGRKSNIELKCKLLSVQFKSPWNVKNSFQIKFDELPQDNRIIKRFAHTNWRVFVSNLQYFFSQINASFCYELSNKCLLQWQKAIKIEIISSIQTDSKALSAHSQKKKKKKNNKTKKYKQNGAQCA